MDKARNLVRELLEVPDTYEVLFLQGGASLGFLTAAFNFMKKDGSAAYVNTGAWAGKSLKEAARLGNAKEIASSKSLALSGSMVKTNFLRKSTLPRRSFASRERLAASFCTVLENSLLKSYALIIERVSRVAS